jgi:mRNA interferase RelE/StbE
MSKKRCFEYEIQYTKAADKFLKEHEEIRSEYEAAIKELLIGDHPEKIDVKRIKGKRNDYYRIRLGNCRVVYAIINGRIVVIKTLLAGSRGDVYKKMSGLK